MDTYNVKKMCFALLEAVSVWIHVISVLTTLFYGAQNGTGDITSCLETQVCLWNVRWLATGSVAYRACPFGFYLIVTGHHHRRAVHLTCDRQHTVIISWNDLFINSTQMRGVCMVCPSVCVRESESWVLTPWLCIAIKVTYYSSCLSKASI